MNINKLAQINYLDIAKFFLDNFRKIKNIEEVKKYFGSKITDITQDKIEQWPELLIMNNEFPGQIHYDFSFRENNKFWGELSIDYIDNILKNVKCQLFAEGLISNYFGLNNKYNQIYKLFSNQFGEPKNLMNYLANIMTNVNYIGWTDEINNMLFTLSENKKQSKTRSYVSFAISKQENMMKND